MRWRLKVEVGSGKLFALILGCLVTATSFAGRTANQEWVKENFIGKDKEATISPAEVTGEKMSSEFPDELVGVPVDTELTFEITFGDIHRTKGSTLVEA